MACSGLFPCGIVAKNVALQHKKKLLNKGNVMFDFWIQFALVLTAILIGIRRGGVALGLIGGLGSRY